MFARKWTGRVISWPLMTLTSEKVTSGYGRCLDMSQTRIMIYSLVMRLFSAFFGGKAMNGNVTFCVWPDLWRHRWHRSQLFQLHLKDLVRDSLLPFEFLTWIKIGIRRKEWVTQLLSRIFLKSPNFWKFWFFQHFSLAKNRPPPKLQIFKKPDYIYYKSH